jgi:localization factor PodJL
VKGIRPETRESAKEAARRAGQTLGQWLNDTIQDRAVRPDDSLHLSPTRAETSSRHLRDRLDDLRERLDQMGRGAASRRRPAAHQEDDLADVLSAIDRRLGALAEVREAPRRRPAPEPSHEPTYPPQAARGAPYSCGTPSHPAPQDVFSSDLERAVAELSAERDRLDGRLSAPPAPALDARLAALNARLEQPRPRVAPPTGPDLTGLQAQIARLTQEVAGLRRAPEPDRGEDLRRTLADLASSLHEMAPRSAIRSLEDQIRDLANRIDASREQGVPAQALHGLEGAVRDVRDGLMRLADRDTTAPLTREIAALAARIDALAEDDHEEPDTFAELRRDLGHLRELVADTAPRHAVDALADDIGSIAKRLDDFVAAGRPAGLTDIADLHGRLDRLADRLDDARPADLGGLMQEVQSLSARIDRLGQASARPATPGTLEPQIARLIDMLEQRASAAGEAVPPQIIGLLDDLSAKIDQIGLLSRGTVSGEGPDASQIEAMLSRLVARVESADTRFERLDGIERALSDLFVQVEETRLASIESAERAARALMGNEHAAAPAADLGGLRAGLDDMRQLQADSERRHTQTLNAVHGTLERLVDRLTAIESDLKRPPVLASAPAVAPDRAHDMAEDDLDPVAYRPASPSLAARGFERPMTFEPEPAPAMAHMAPMPAPMAPPPVPMAAPMAAPVAKPAPSLSASLADMDDPDAPLEPETRFDTPAAGVPAMRGAAAAPAPIDPNLPADFPLEPGSVRTRPTASAAQRIADAQAALGGAAGHVAPRGQEPQSRSDYLTAARRAAQAAANVANTQASSASQSGLAGQLRDAGEKGKALLSGLAGRFTRKSETAAAPPPAAAPLPPPSAPVDLDALAAQSMPPARGKRNAAPSAAGRTNSRAILFGGVAAATLVIAAALVMDMLGPTHPDPTMLPPVVTTAPATSEPAVTAQPAPGPQSDATGTGAMADLVTGSIPTQQPGARAPSLSAPISGPPATMSVTGGTAAGDQRAIMMQRAMPTAPDATPGPDGLPPSIGSQALRRAAADGDAAAQFEIGARYGEGRGVPQNLAEAARWFERAATQGLAPAQFRLASLYEKGHGVPRDLNVARRYYRFAAEQGNARAMHNLAVLFAEGAQGGAPDYRSAAQWFRRAADHGMTDSQYNLAVLHARGLGVDQDMVESFKWFEIGARRGDTEAAKKRDEVQARLTPAQLTAGRAAAQAFTAIPEPDAAVRVAAPEGGWDRPAVAAPRNRPNNS